MPMHNDTGRPIVDSGRFALTIERLCHELIENHGDFANTCLVGIQPRGAHVAERIHQRLLGILQVPRIDFGLLDVTFYRDDFRKGAKPLIPNPVRMDFIVEGRRVILVDDVLYTGRTVRAALSALQHYGRAERVEMLALVDRRFNRHLPIKADYVGLRVDALDKAYVKVEWADRDGEDRILLFSEKQ